MEFRPLNDTLTILVPQMQVTNLPFVKAADPKGVLPGGIYRVMRWERLRQGIVLGLAASFLLAMIILITLYAVALPSTWATFILPAIGLLISLWKLADAALQMNAFNRAMTRYREDLRIGLASTPPFISKLYLQLHKKQITHNWATTFIIFYGGILTLALWLLKDANWWIFEFDVWISALFSNPTLMSWLFTVALIVVVVLHIGFAVQRKRRILDIDAYFGMQLIPSTELETMRQAQNKFWRRAFIFSLLGILVIPLVVKIIIKLARRKSA